ncbi:hypothetical protein PF011_g16184 [Phytophthora fragariae]|uniref:RxLR effector protein n=1 Tax=Phytophthora fragariae TaxID=53985 RepID=A0A6A3JP93_9STRA|nr:hypothetical protein PF011_g16184 [Phytophthora fragariae]
MKLGTICATAILFLGLTSSSTIAKSDFNGRFAVTADHANSNAASGSGSTARNLRGARALATTSGGTTVYTENGGDASSSSSDSSSSDGSDASRVVGAFATTAGLFIAMSVYLI